MTKDEQWDRAMVIAQEIKDRLDHGLTCVEEFATPIFLHLGQLQPSPAQEEKLTLSQAEAIEAEMRRIEADPSTTLHQLRLFMQGLMPCGHAVGNLLTCPTPPFGCVICNAPSPAQDGDDLGPCRCGLATCPDRLRHALEAR